MTAYTSEKRRKSVGDGVSAVLPNNGKAWYKIGHLVRLNLIIVSLVLFSSANGYDGSLMNGLQALDQWQTYMKTPTGAWLGFINAIYWLGAGISYPIAAWASNKFGRKPGVFFGYTWLLLGIFVIFSKNHISFLLSRFFIGCASAWFGNAVPLLINEIAYPSHRGVANALFMCGWYVGGTIAGFTTFGTRDYSSNWAWRIPTMLQLLLPLVALPGLLACPESPRWLLSRNKTDEAQKILTRIHAGGDVNSPLVAHEMIEIGRTIHAEQQASASTGYLDMLKTPGNRKRFFISVSLGIFGQWVGNGVAGYYLSLVLKTVGITSVTNQTLLAGFLQVWNLVFAVGAACFVDKVGRRPLFLASATVMCLSFVVITALSASFASTQHAATGVAVIPFLFIFYAGYDIALTPFLTAYPCEIWTFAFRAKGLSVTWVSTILAIFFNTFINPIALESISWRYYFVFIAVLVAFGLTAYFFYPETRGYTLEQIAVIFDGDDASVPNADETVKEAVEQVNQQRRKESIKEGVVSVETKHNEVV